VQTLEHSCALQSQHVSSLTAAAAHATHRAEAAEVRTASSSFTPASSSSASDGTAAELEALQGQMEGWLEEMRVLKEQEQVAVQEAMGKGKLLAEALAARDKSVASLEECQNQVRVRARGTSVSECRLQSVAFRVSPPRICQVYFAQDSYTIGLFFKRDLSP